MGGANSTLAASTDQEIKAIDPNAAGNAGLVNRHKIHLRRLSTVMHFIFKNNITRTSYTSFQPNKDKFVYKDEITGREITCGLILFKMALDVMKPQLVIDHRAKERELESLTLENCANDVRTFLTKMQEKRMEIDALCKNNVEFDGQRWLTLCFEQLVKTNCPDFLNDVKRQRSEWIKDSSKFGAGQFCVELNNLYVNYKSTGAWDETAITH